MQFYESEKVVVFIFLIKINIICRDSQYQLKLKWKKVEELSIRTFNNFAFIFSN